MVLHRDHSDTSLPRRSESLSSRFLTFASSFRSSVPFKPDESSKHDDPFFLSSPHLSASHPSPLTAAFKPRSRPLAAAKMRAPHNSRYLPNTAEAGRSRVWCRGLCMTGPDFRGTIFTFLLAIAIFVLETIFSFPWLLENRPIIAIPLFVTMISTFTVTVLAAYLASTTDPGIIPRSNLLPPSIVAFPATRERVVTYASRSVTLKFCDTCRIWRPPRTSHCATCNNCVRRFDHHCPWLGNDVGLRNYRSYFCFVVFASIAETIAIATSVLTLHWTTADFRMQFPDQSYASSIRRALSSGGTSVNIGLVLLCFLALLFTGGLTGFHIYLMAQNITTAESFKKRARNASSPDDDLRNCSAFLMLQCTQRQTSALVDGFDGPSYPEETDFNGLVDAQVEREQRSRGTVSSPPLACRIPIGDD